MDNRRNYYRILHVQPDAPTEIIRSSYRTLMHKLRRHPDLGGDHFTATLINEAYAVLTDPGLRAAYDEVQRANGTSKAAATADADADTLPDVVPACEFCGAAHGFPGHIHAAATCTTCNSPLAPVVRQQLDSGKRSVGRVPRRVSLTYFTGWPGQGPFPGETRDISLHGLRFVTNSAVPVTKVLKVECDPLTALTRVIACDESRERDWRWLVRAEYVTVRFRRSRGAFVSSRV